MKRILSTISLAMAVMFLAQIAAPAQEPVRSSCADCPYYKGGFSIENNTGVAITYYVRWGNKSQWKEMRLESGKIMTHRYPLGYDPNATVPTPYVRFDRIGGDGANFTEQVYKMEFYAVGSGGYGPPTRNTTEPKRYVFRYAANGRDLDLKAMR
jgi:hypothetical protein